MNNVFLFISIYLYICGGFAITTILKVPRKWIIFLLWPLVPIYVLIGLFFESQEEIDETIEEYHD